MNKEFNEDTWKEVLSIFEDELKKAGIDYNYKVKIYKINKEFDEAAMLQIFKIGEDNIDWGVAQMPLGFAHNMLLKNKESFLERVISVLINYYE